MNFIITLQANITLTKIWDYHPGLFLDNQIVVIIRCSFIWGEDIFINGDIFNCKIMGKNGSNIEIVFQMLVMSSAGSYFSHPFSSLWDRSGNPCCPRSSYENQFMLTAGLCDTGQFQVYDSQWPGYAFKDFSKFFQSHQLASILDYLHIWLFSSPLFCLFFLGGGGI